MGFVEFLYLYDQLAVFAQPLLPRLKMVIQGPGAVMQTGFGVEELVQMRHNRHR
jgi:hypothetical protein